MVSTIANDYKLVKLLCLKPLLSIMRHTSVVRIKIRFKRYIGMGKDITKIIFIAEILLIYIYNGRQLNTFQTTF